MVTSAATWTPMHLYCIKKELEHSLRSVVRVCPHSYNQARESVDESVDDYPISNETFSRPLVSCDIKIADIGTYRVDHHGATEHSALLHSRESAQ